MRGTRVTHIPMMERWMRLQYLRTGSFRNILWQWSNIVMQRS